MAAIIRPLHVSYRTIVANDDRVAIMELTARPGAPSKSGLLIVSDNTEGGRQPPPIQAPGIAVPGRSVAVRCSTSFISAAMSEVRRLQLLHETQITT